MKTSTIMASTLVVAVQIFGVAVAASDCEVSPPKQPSPQTPVPSNPTPQGCWSSKGNFTESELKGTGVSTGSCREWCLDHLFTVSAVHGSDCFCGFAYPPVGTQVSEDQCNYPCPAYCPEACGSLGDPGHYSVMNLGVELDVPNYVEESSTTSSVVEPTTTPSSATNSPSSPVTTAPTNKPQNDDKSSTNVGGIVAGSVVGVAAVLGLAGGIFWFMRRRRNSEIEEEHRRNAAVNAFISGSKPPGSSGSISMTDSRLDPIMAHRRMSDGSIADNEDYSRKILRVTNA